MVDANKSFDQERFNHYIAEFTFRRLLFNEVSFEELCVFFPPQTLFDLISTYQSPQDDSNDQNPEQNHPQIDLDILARFSSPISHKQLTNVQRLQKYIVEYARFSISNSDFVSDSPREPHQSSIDDMEHILTEILATVTSEDIPVDFYLSLINSGLLFHQKFKQTDDELDEMKAHINDLCLNPIAFDYPFDTLLKKINARLMILHVDSTFSLLTTLRSLPTKLLSLASISPNHITSLQTVQAAYQSEVFSSLNQSLPNETRNLFDLPYEELTHRTSQVLHQAINDKTSHPTTSMQDEQHLPATNMNDIGRDVYESRSFREDHRSIHCVVFFSDLHSLKRQALTSGQSISSVDSTFHSFAASVSIFFLLFRLLHSTLAPIRIFFY